MNCMLDVIKSRIKITSFKLAAAQMMLENGR